MSTDDPGRHVNLRRLFASGLVYSVSDAAVAIAALSLTPLYTRRLSVAEFGVYGVMAAVRQMLTPIVGLGLVGAFRTMYHAGTEEDHERLIPTIVNAGLIYSGLATLVLSAATFLAFTTSGGHYPFRVQVLLTLWATFASASYFIPLTIFTMERQPGRYASYIVGLAFSNVVATLVLCGLIRGGVVGALAANLFTALLGMFLAWLVIRDRYRSLIDRRQLRTAMRLSLPTLPHTVAATAWRFSDRLFLTSLATLSQAGIYTLASTIASVVPLAVGGLSTAFGPEFYRRTAHGDPTLPKDWARLFTVFVITLAWISLGVAVLAPQVVAILGTSLYSSAAGTVPLLVLGQALGAGIWHFSPGVERAHRTWAYPAASLPAFVVSIGLNLLLVPTYGATGAAWAFVLASAVQLVIFSTLSLRFFSFPVEWTALARTAILVAGVFIASRAADTLPDPLSFVLILLALASFPVLVLASGAVHGVDLRRAWQTTISRTTMDDDAEPPGSDA